MGRTAGNAWRMHLRRASNVIIRLEQKVKPLIDPELKSGAAATGTHFVDILLYTVYCTHAKLRMHAQVTAGPAGDVWNQNHSH